MGNGLFQPNPSPEVRAKLAERGRAIMSDPAHQAAMREARMHGWSAERIEKLRDLAGRGWTMAAIAREMRVHPDTLRARTKEYGVEIINRVSCYKAAAAVLTEWWPTLRPAAEIFPLYEAALRAKTTRKAMGEHALRLKLRRPTNILDQTRRANAKVMIERWHQLRAEKAPEIQRALDEHGTYMGAQIATGVSERLIRIMVREGLVTKAPRKKAPPAPATPPKRYAPISYGVAMTRPGPIKAESVEAFLARGGQITRCPTVALQPTQATIPEADREAIRVRREEQERALKRSGGNHWLAARAAFFARRAKGAVA